MDAYVGSIILWPVPWVPSGWHLCDGALLPVNNFQALFALIGTTYGGNGTTTFALPDLRNRVPVGTMAGNGPFPSHGTVNPTPGFLDQSVTLTLNNLPTHTHTAAFTGTGGGGSGPLQASGPVSLPFSATVNSTGTATIGSTAAGAPVRNPSTGALLGTAAGPAGAVYLPAGSTPTVALGGTNAVSVTGTAAGTVTGSMALPVTGATGITGGSVAVATTGAGLPFTVTTPSQALNFIIALQGIFPSQN